MGAYPLLFDFVGAGAALIIKAGDDIITNEATVLKFTGTGVTVTESPLGSGIVTINIPGGGDTYTVNSGLSLQTGSTTNFQFGSDTLGGSPLLHNTYLELDNYTFIITSDIDAQINKQVLFISSSDIRIGDLENVLSNNFLSINNNSNITQLHGTNTDGLYLDYDNNKYKFGDIDAQSSGTHFVIDSNAETFAFWHQNGGTFLNERIVALDAYNGQLILDKYGSGIFTGTLTKYLAVNLAGAVIEVDGVQVDADSGLSIDSNKKIQLGGATNLLSPLLHDTYINLDDYAFHINGGTASTYNLLIDKPGVSNSEITIDNSSFNLQTTTIATDIVAGLDITSSFNGAASLRRTNTVSGRYSGFYFINDKLGWNVTDNITQYEYELPPAGTGYTAGALTDKLGNGKLSWETVSGGGLEYAIASGTNTYAVTIVGVTVYTDGDIYSIKFTNSNTTTSTININGLGAKDLHKDVSTSLASGDIISGQVLIIQYDGTNFQVIGISGGSGGVPIGGTAGQILTKIDATNYNTQWADNISSIEHIQQYVKNNQGSTVTKGQAVYMNGADGTNATIKLAQANAEATSSKTLGLLEQDLNNNAKGYVITEGLLTGLDTSAATADGDPVWLSPTTPGGLVYGLAAKPYAPSHLVFIGIVIRKNASNGEIYVKVQNGFEMDELHNVQARTPSLNDTLYYDTADSQWKTQSVNSLLNTSIKSGSASVIFDGAGGVITANTIAYVQIPYNGTITGWTLVSSVSGSCTVTAFKDTYGNFPPITTADDIFVTPPAISGAIKAQNLAAPTNSPRETVTAGDWIGFKITGVTTVTWVNLTLSITKT